jgi:hypothetical protein
MMRTRLQIAEILIWTAGSYLLVCLMTAPPKRRYLRITNAWVTPAVVIEEKCAPSSSPEPFLLPLVPDPFLYRWRHSALFLNGSLYRLSEVGYCPDVRRTGWLVLLISGATLLAITLCRRMRHRIPLPPAFEVSVNICGPVS